jgi:hypothetical protein
LQQQHDEAWTYLALANSLQKGVNAEGGDDHDDRLVSALLSLFPEPARPPPAGDTYAALMAGVMGFRDPTPVFVVGMPRSGSTLVEQILASHPGVVGAGMPIVSRKFDSFSLFPAAARWGHLRGPHGPGDGVPRPHACLCGRDAPIRQHAGGADPGQPPWRRGSQYAHSFQKFDIIINIIFKMSIFCYN